jgi:hypothetical protein
MDIVQRLRLHYGSSAVADDAADEILRLRAALELIAGTAADKLQALQARAALDNIGPETK